MPSLPCSPWPCRLRGPSTKPVTSSDYDLTVTDAALQFERKNASGRRLEMRRGALAVNSQAVALGAGDRQRVAAFESRVRELVPKVKTIAQHGVDLMVVAVREEAVSASPGSAANRQVNARVDARAQELKTKIASSVTSKEWHAEALQGYMAVLLSDVAPLIAGDLAQQAVDRTLKGDLAGVVALKDRAIALRPRSKRASATSSNCCNRTSRNCARRCAS